MVEIHATEPMAMRPMASMCKGIAEKPRSRVLLVIPGLVLLVVGVLILLEPKVLIWLMGAVTIVFGMLFLLMGNFIHRRSSQN